MSSTTNTQAPSPVDKRVDGWLHVHHVFPTIQGEGPFAGRPAIFIRLFGCNLQCPACDTDYTSRDDLLRPKDIYSLVKLHLCREDYCSRVKPIIVITGGEPFRQNIVPLILFLTTEGLTVQIETNGTLWLDNFDLLPRERTHVVCSPKTPRINYDLSMRADAFKYVLQAGHVDPIDGLPTDTMLNPGHTVARPPTMRQLGECPIYVQPLDESLSFVGQFAAGTIDGPLGQANYANLEAARDSCFKFGYRLSVQTHKLAGLE